MSAPGKTGFRGAGDLAAIRLVMLKDLRQEVRSRAVMTSTVFFAAITLVIMGFAVGGESEILARVAPGVLWVALAFAGVITASQSWVGELEDGAFEQLAMYPVPRATLYLGKMLANWLYLAALALVLVPVSLVVYDVTPGDRWPLLLLVLLLGTLAFAIIGTFYAALTVSMRARESLLPLLMFPVVIPALLAAVGASTELMRFADTTLAMDWLRLLVAFVLGYVVVCTILFPFLIEE